MKDDLGLREKMVLLGGPQIGFMTNPETKDRPTFVEINGEKVVCTARGGECRHNPDYHSLGMRDERSWTTPIVDRDCPDRCGYKMLVCDDHPDDECENSRTYYPQYNKFQGQFGSYCREFSRLKREK